MNIREFDDIVFIFDSDTSALLRTRIPLLWQEKINGWTHELSSHADGRRNERKFVRCRASHCSDDSGWC